MLQTKGFVYIGVMKDKVIHIEYNTPQAKALDRFVLQHRDVTKLCNNAPVR